MDPRKVQPINDWATPIFVRDVQCFFGFVNFYQCFIALYSLIVVLLTQLTKKDQPFSWEVEVEVDNAFQSLKASFTTTPFNYFSKPFVLETNASDFAIGPIFSQLGKDNIFSSYQYVFS